MMNFSAEMINAYADGELEGSEKAEFERALLNDADLQRALDEVVLLKARVSSAYASLDVPQPSKPHKVRYSAVLYGFLLVLAFSGGWLSSDIIESPLFGSVLQQYADTAGQGHESQAQARLEGLQPVGLQQVGSDAPGKYILHIGTHDAQKFKSVLDKAEALVKRYQHDMQLIELEIIANAKGLDLFRESASPYAQRVRELAQRYPNIRFIACTNAIERLREKGIEPGLLKSVQQGPTALDQVVKRMNQGWTYIKI